MLLPRLFIPLVCFATLASAVRVAFIAGTLFIRFFFWKCIHHSLRQIPAWATITRARVGLIIAGKETFFFQDLEKYYMNKNASRRNIQGSPYKINGQRCYDHAGQPCKLYSRARDVVRLARESGADLVSYFFSLFFLLGFYDKVTCLSLSLSLALVVHF
jgi:hypothetical protein